MYTGSAYIRQSSPEPRNSVAAAAPEAGPPVPAFAAAAQMLLDNVSSRLTRGYHFRRDAFH